MWKSLPIQRKGQTGPHLGTIYPQFPYKRSEDVHVAEWKDVPESIQKWALSVWRDSFGIARNPMHTTDLLAWIPGVATLVAQRGYWVDAYQSKSMINMSYNFVHPERRREGLAGKLIHTLGLESSKRWDTDAFLFELQNVPPSLATAIPIAKFHYIWIPCLRTDARWTLISERRIQKLLRGRPGFHPLRYSGCRGYEHSESKHIIVMDPHNDVIAYDSMSDFLEFGVDGSIGHFCRVFSPYGVISVFAENMFFQSPSYYKSIQLL